MKSKTKTERIEDLERRVAELEKRPIPVASPPHRPSPIDCWCPPGKRFCLNTGCPRFARGHMGAEWASGETRGGSDGLGR